MGVVVPSPPLPRSGGAVLGRLEFKRQLDFPPESGEPTARRGCRIRPSPGLRPGPPAHRGRVMASANCTTPDVSGGRTGKRIHGQRSTDPSSGPPAVTNAAFPRHHVAVDDGGLCRVAGGSPLAAAKPDGSVAVDWRHSIGSYCRQRSWYGPSRQTAPLRDASSPARQACSALGIGHSAVASQSSRRVRLVHVDLLLGGRSRRGRRRWLVARPCELGTPEHRQSVTGDRILRHPGALAGFWISSFMQVVLQTLIEAHRHR